MNNLLCYGLILAMWVCRTAPVLSGDHKMRDDQSLDKTCALGFTRAHKLFVYSSHGKEFIAFNVTNVGR